MNIQSIESSSESITNYAKSKLRGLRSPDALNICIKNDYFVFNSGETEDFITYTDKGLPCFQVHGVDVSEGTEMTDEEKWAAIHEKYKGIPMYEKVYVQMLLDLNASGLITREEASALSAHEMAVAGDKIVDYDLQDGIIGNNEIPASFYIVDLEELLSDVYNENRIYEGFTEETDPRPFLNSFYPKLIGCFLQETA